MHWEVYTKKTTKIGDKYTKHKFNTLDEAIAFKNEQRARGVRTEEPCKVEMME